MRFSLSELSFGSKTNTLSARELAIVSIISCFLAATGSHQQLILDLPAHLLTHTDIDHIRAMWMGLTNTCKVHYVGNSLDPAQPIDDTPCVSYKTNQTILTLSSTAPPSHKNHPCVIHRGELLQVRQHSHDSTNSFYSLATRVSSAIETSGSSAQLIPIPVFPTAAKSFRVIGEVLGLLDPLAQLYAASLDARMHGLTPKDFSLFGARSHRYRCHVCRGLGVVLTHNDNLPRPLAAPCTTCRGLRCKNPVSSSLFRGVSFSTMLNQSISHSQSTLSALVKAKRTIDTVVSLDLHHLPLGMPVALLSRSEHQRLLVAQAVQQSRATKPVIVVVEEPRAGLTEKHYQAIQTVRDVGLREGTLAWIETYSLRT